MGSGFVGPPAPAQTDDRAGLWPGGIASQAVVSARIKRLCGICRPLYRPGRQGIADCAARCTDCRYYCPARRCVPACARRSIHSVRCLGRCWPGCCWAACCWRVAGCGCLVLPAALALLKLFAVRRRRAPADSCRQCAAQSGSVAPAVPATAVAGIDACRAAGERPVFRCLPVLRMQDLGW